MNRKMGISWMTGSSLLVLMMVLTGCAQEQAAPLNDVTDVAPLAEAAYDPFIDPSKFTSTVTNRHFTLTPGKRLVYEGKTEDGTERIEWLVTDQKKRVMGVETTVVWDRVWLNDELIEDTYDWYAQDADGNVWYFGEDTHELLDGKIINNAGAWEAGVDGAKPGIIMPANPIVGQTSRQEYYKGVAEDMADVLAVDETVTVKAGTYTGCLKTLDYTPLEPGVQEHKVYCPQVGGVVLEVNLEDGERIELIGIGDDIAASPPAATQPPEQFTTQVTEEKAKEIALERVPGTVTDIAIERKFGKPVYVVEIKADSGTETDVIIDIDTGEVLDVET